ncbi:MAG: AI-2E family transporter [Rhodospirillaceae bacterium]|jgi:predicted PurR-regulated permease PerM|nr:AI-2E family transporter [Rhodospirillaceae bacterium]MBT4220516.1 AI-2E family transporter [Rhodospirillaceae bacterium]MBT5309427.1 AI-2E family transporter [Rhodospirillaceae bacterium]MBT7356063.1 AI-2E family transporter [Rhodospirillaceae bacterium]
MSNSISREQRAMIWLFGLAVFCGLLYMLSGVLLPFVAGLGVAYFFDPVADRLEESGLSRGAAAGLIVGFFLALMTAILMLLYPLLQAQVLGLISHIPELIDAAQVQAAPILEMLSESLSSGEMSDLKGAAESYAGKALGWLGSLLQDLWSGGLAFFNLLSLVVITPLVAFYLLRDWDKMVHRFDELLPRPSASTIREQVKEIDGTIAAFIRGQSLVCLTLGVYYAIGLTVVGLDFGLLVGLGTGLLSFIPYVGAAIGLLTGFGIAVMQYSDPTSVAIVVAIFLVGQTAESYVLTPRLVGERVGLHPVWIIFALLAGGALFGFTGVLLAVPVVAIVGVLIRFFISRYLASPLYGGDVTGK